MKNIKPFGPTIGKTKISKRFINKLNEEFDKKSNYRKIDYSSKLASQIKNEVKISSNFIKNFSKFHSTSTLGATLLSVVYGSVVLPLECTFPMISNLTPNFVEQKFFICSIESGS